MEKGGVGIHIVIETEAFIIAAQRENVKFVSLINR